MDTAQSRYEPQSRKAVATPPRVFEPAYFLSVLWLVAVMPLYVRCIALYFRKYKRFKRLYAGWSARFALCSWRKQAPIIIAAGANGYHLPVSELGLEAAQRARLEREMARQPVVVIGEIDRHGRLCSFYGPIPNRTLVTRREFRPRTRFAVRLIVLGGWVGIEKSYGTHRREFITELVTLYHLNRAGCRVPAILDVDFENCRLVTSFLPGTALRAALVREGARLDEEDMTDPLYRGTLSRAAVRLLRAQEGKRVLPQALTPGEVTALFQALRELHAVGGIGNDVNYSNVIFDKARRPYWVDFEHAFFDTRLAPEAFRIGRDRDIEKFNTFFGTSFPSFERMQRAIRLRPRPADARTDMPIYFGAGLSVGSLWRLDAGYGFWRSFLRHHLPSVRGKRVLDLYPRAGLYAVELARRGASEVVAVEPNPELFTQAQWVKQGFEWADNACYNVTLEPGDPLRGLEAGAFDMVTALNGLPCDDVDTAAQWLRRIRAAAPCVALAGGLRTRRGELLSAETTLQLLRAHGFTRTEWIDPRRHGWRLFIGSAE